MDEVVDDAMKLIEETEEIPSQMETQTQPPTQMLMTEAPALSPVQQLQEYEGSPSLFFDHDQMDQDIMQLAAGEGEWDPNMCDNIPKPVYHPNNDMTSPDSVDTSFSQQINLNNAYDMNSPEYHISSPPQSVHLCQSGSGSLPRITTLMSSNNVQPVVNISDVPTSLRFRYHSEIKDKPLSNSASDTNKKSMKIQVGNYVGPLNILVDLVVDSSGEEHVNEIYLPTGSASWKKEHKYLILQNNQIQPCKTYELPSYGVVRMKKDKTGNARSTPSGEARMSTDRVVFRFRVMFLDINGTCTKFSPVVVDSKSCTSNGEPKITHVNPTTVRCSDETEVTLLCENVTAKAKVYFFSSCPMFRKEATVTYRHKKMAIVVKAPKFCTPSGGNAKVQIVCSDSMISEPWDFVYKPESETGRPMMKRPATYPPCEGSSLDSHSVKQRLKKSIYSKHLQTDSLSDPTQDEGEDEVDSVSTRGDGALNIVSSEDEQRSIKTLKKLSFGIAEFDIGFEERLCQEIARSLEAMTSTDYEGLTPLARAIVFENMPVVQTFLENMPAAVKEEVLPQRFGESHLSHLLLTSQLKEHTFAVIQLLSNAGDDWFAQDVDGNNIVHLLLRRENEAVVLELLNLAENDENMSENLKKLVNTKNNEGRTPLHQAVLQGLQVATEALLGCGANVNVKSTKTGYSALHYAVLESKPPALVGCLLKMPDIDVNATTFEGKTALDLSEQNDNKELSELLCAFNGVCLYSESSDTEDEEEDEDEDEEEEDSEEETSDEDYVDAVDTPKTVTWEDLKKELTEKLDGSDFCALARRLDISASKVRLFEKTKDPSKLFFHQVTKEFGHQLPAALCDINRGDLAAYASRLSQG